MPLETLSEAVRRLEEAGYTESYRAESGGLRSARGEILPPEALIVDEVVRFEGASDPADEAILFALRCLEGGQRGTWALAYGPDTRAEEADLARRLHASAGRGSPVGAARRDS